MQILSAAEWITCASVAFLSLPLSGWLLYDEIRSRQRTPESVQCPTGRVNSRSTRSMEAWSFLAIMIPLLHALSILLEFVSLSCLITWYLGDICVFFQQLCVGFYQIARLQLVTTGKLGYPGWLYSIMYCIGAALFVNTFFLLLICDQCLRTDCGLSMDLDFYVQYASLISVQRDAALWRVWSNLYFVVLLCWDSCTVILYGHKIYTATRLVRPVAVGGSDRSEVKRRLDDALRSIQRVFILTIFYQIGLILIFFIRRHLPALVGMSDRWEIVLQTAVEPPLSIIYALSIYLMQEHNNVAYARFLKVVVVLRLHWLCCLWRHIVTKQLAAYSVESELELSIQQDGQDGQHEKEGDTKEPNTPIDVTVNQSSTPPTVTGVMSQAGSAGGLVDVDVGSRGDVELTVRDNVTMAGASPRDLSSPSGTGTASSKTTTSEVERRHEADREYWKGVGK